MEDGLDGGPVDASEMDAPLDDGDLPDAPPDDAEVPDAPVDTGVDASPCVPATETCDLTDQDCDGRVDESGCAGCRWFEHGGHVYQDCPHITGFAAWGGACRRIGPGYDLAVIETSTEDDAIDAATSELSWIGLNDFDANGTYIWADRSAPTYVAPFVVAQGMWEHEACFAIHGTGEWDDIGCNGGLRVICEGDPADRCTGTARSDTTCDGVDDDCDGAFDEDCDLDAGCTSLTFWDRVYLNCTTVHPFMAARTVCVDAGYDIATIDNQTEDDALDDFVGESWIGLRQEPGAAAPIDDWGWVDGSASDFRGWGGGQPDDSNGAENGQEDCTRMRHSDDWGDIGCTTALPFVCRREVAGTD